MPNTKRTTQNTNTTARMIRVKHPVGTNHFQFRDHQPPCGGCGGESDGVDGTGGGVDSIGPFCRSLKSKSSNLLLLDFRLSTFSANHRERPNQVRIRLLEPASKEFMKKLILSMALSVAAPFAWAQVSETTTTT